ncbi:hypothetical protein EC844_101415 [Acinetobacter calcoaceticus]|uniref:Uncharacterized protein n=1 Tax=Acinetobacter calcoaceticus TaxID=471 RepID=A0A4R1Y1V4_ACICA|nr:hypothetical protein EC844_101415 [Acinetobacter calcoaceticus]
MDVLNQVLTRISTLRAGEKWTVSAQDLFLSRVDFQSISVFLSRESEKGLFSVDLPSGLANWFERSTFTIIKH